MTTVRTLAALVLAVLALRAQSEPLLLASLAVYWVGDVLDGAVARWTDTETRAGAHFDILCDRLNSTVFYVGWAVLHPGDALPIAVFLTQFVVVDAYLSTAFLHWPLRSPNYFDLVEPRVFALNWSKAGKAVNSGALALLLIFTDSFWLPLLLVIGRAAGQVLVGAAGQPARPAGPRRVRRRGRRPAARPALGGSVVLLASLALGLASALFPPVNIEAYLVGLAALHSGPLLWLGRPARHGRPHGRQAAVLLARPRLAAAPPAAVALAQARPRRAPGRPGGRAGPDAVARAGRRRRRGGGGVAATSPAPVERLRLRTRVRGRVRGWSGLDRVEAVAGRPWATALLCLVSASVGLPPFAVVAVLLGRFRMPVVAFLLVGGLGRLVRFAAVAGLSGSLLG